VLSITAAKALEDQHVPLLAQYHYLGLAEVEGEQVAVAVLGEAAVLDD